MGERNGQCPHCKKDLEDLWDFDWKLREATNSSEVMFMECWHCRKPIDVIRRVRVTYEVVEPPPSELEPE